MQSAEHYVWEPLQQEEEEGGAGGNILRENPRSEMHVWGRFIGAKYSDTCNIAIVRKFLIIICVFLQDRVCV